MNFKSIISPNKITFFRIILSFIILFIFFLEDFWNLYLFLILVWFLITFNEVTDIIDGYVARKYGLVSNAGKILDPYADVLQHLTYFVFFFYKGITPYYFFVIFIYREISVGVVRNLIIQFNIVQQAKFLGKLKSLFYAIATFSSLFLYSLDKLKISIFVENFISSILNLDFNLSFCVGMIYFISAFLTIISLIEYVIVFLDLIKYEK
ncbi:CDP-diacylglycerol--glycerol-3-phosphate 3-phosphatidyltransferase [Borrelia miyamotoi]|uniref:CDP-diacylglycerol--glycerol-3-phosphate 3-phosphatidyltransferase n=1 Tax=Borrelia miyamotoi TaxID=47466 RepID=A0AAQ3AG13_9SPIR|nr:CDP-diacylglycerol--glycerol-3-phosphate 3-phosphatidyltransferase [Borrelia miyamotoi]AGT27665.1 CDP-diacylglycerol--glycerol-3-phosphate 3-phosphatidyltransferase [Borrelia miyamotoi LB-2001]AJA58826.1 CDP-diacylglycerol--glycerol-3-phosphate 3-phosphatidyltransferase [Borrelia miyamotoi]AOW95910.1 CDP-diacylglycerol--glycerol-3-phosphate 3-phosphatidyltransferase [Borrelia miyamotoi]QTL83801.1 CDP-diacylglycerol--glycerol-3-phosphate 3-phosphatidyltransferase [Borrelia miyamotoi]WAZ84893